MGGGDLNLKKSWHPSTFHNLEKVWKAEQRHESEQKKIAQLQQELQEERAREEMQRTAIDAGVIKQKDDRVDWLYSGPGSSVNREEYLLGRKIDRLVDPTLAAEEREKQALASGPGALFVSVDATSSTADLAVKVREDPLFAIRKREEEAKRTLASNPVKMKQLQQLVSKKKQSKKHKKTKHKHTDSSRPSGHTEDHSKKHRRGRAPSPKYSHDEEKRSRPSEHRPRSQHSASRYHPYSKPHSHTRHMDPEELQRRREEMMASAREHGRERERKLRRHEEEQREEEGEAGHSQDFLQPLRVQSLTSTHSLEERLHRNIGSIQRTSAQLNTHFLRK